MAVLPSAEVETLVPWKAPALSEPIISAPCWIQTAPLLLQTLADPVLGAKGVTLTSAASLDAPTMAVFPSADSDTEAPCAMDPPESLTNLVPCWVHTPPFLLQTHAAPFPFP